jgi:hypothetical protein
MITKPSFPITASLAAGNPRFIHRHNADGRTADMRDRPLRATADSLKKFRWMSCFTLNSADGTIMQPTDDGMPLSSKHEWSPP